MSELLKAFIGVSILFIALMLELYSIHSTLKKILKKLEEK